jgi:hypothetical protein
MEHTRKTGTHGQVLVLDKHYNLLARFPVGADDPANAAGYIDRFTLHAGYDVEPSRPGARIPDGCEDLRIEVYTERGTLWESLNCMVVPA